MDIEIKELPEITYCDKCKDPTGMFVTILGKERIVPVICSCRKKELEKEKELEEKKELAKRVDELICQGLMDKQFLNNTFDNDNGSNLKILGICKNYVAKWEEVKKENIGMLLYGDVGRGKTFYACCIANELFTKNKVSICITSFPKILDKLMNFDEQSKSLIEKLKTQSLLVIDDFGVERDTEFALEQIFKILDDRLRSGFPTLITTNLDIKVFNEPKTVMQRRIYSRVLEMCPIKILVDNQNNRQIKANNKSILAKQILSENNK
ncbi:MAG: ATP-binding protein [Eubacteriales bacterium]|nr:ATP-binding protein [Eubacteriales bacterium]